MDRKDAESMIKNKEGPEGGLNWYRQANNTSYFCLITLTVTLWGLQCKLTVLPCSNSFEVYHLRMYCVSVSFANVGWGLYVPDSVIHVLPADLFKTLLSKNQKQRM